MLQLKAYPSTYIVAVMCLISIIGSQQGCIPVLVKTGHVLPFSEVLDWSRAVVMVWEEELPTLMATLTAISERVQEQMRDHVRREERNIATKNYSFCR